MRNKGRWKILGGMLLTALLALPAMITGQTPEENYLANAWTTVSKYDGGTYYHRPEYKDYNLFNGIDVSWWQGQKYGAITQLDWAKVHEDGIDFALVRVASRDTSDGSIYEDTCADAHIRGALANDINVGLYFFSQALTEEEAVEEAEYTLALIKRYGWKITMPIAIDREPGSYGRLKGGSLSKEKETDVSFAFCEAIAQAGYQPMIYSNANWFCSYYNLDRVRDSGYAVWYARYGAKAEATMNSSITYSKLSQLNYTIWQYSSSGKAAGYSGSLDMNFWYKDTAVKTKNLQMTENAQDTVSLKWSKAGDAQKYKVYRYDSEQDKYVVVGTTAKRTFTDTDLESGEIYQYKVRGFWEIGGRKYYGIYSDVLTAPTLPGQVTGVEVVETKPKKLTLAWDEVEGADGYSVYLYDDETDSFLLYADVEDGACDYTVTGLLPATVYRFKVQAYLSCGDVTYRGEESEAYAAATKPAAVQELEAETVSAKKILLSWNKVARASGYQIYRWNADKDKFEKLAVVKGASNLSYTDSGLAGATEYMYKVRAYYAYEGTNYCGAYSQTLGIVTKPEAVGALSLSKKAKTITVAWNKVKRASGYEVCRLNQATGKYVKIAVVSGNKTFVYTDEGLKKGETYTYKVRAYKSYNGKKYYGAYSPVTEMKLK